MFTGFRGYWTTQYRHRFSNFSGSASRIFGDKFWVSGYRFTIESFRIQGSPVVGTPASGSHLTGVSTSGSSSDEDRPVWEQSSRKKKPKWLQDTLKEAQEFGTPRELVRTIQMPDRLGMALVASLRDSEPSTFEEAS